ncbi:MAG: diadenylate cyclase CdaA [Minisyncoccia bacterium]|jgi:uncharacterized protein (TIGR00159 family)
MPLILKYFVNFNNYLLLILNNIQIRDILDIFFTALVIYVLIWFLRRTKSLPIILGVFFILLGYGFSYWFNLSLTYRILQTFLGAIIIILAIIFQDEIKRFFYLLGSIKFNRNNVTLSDKSIDALINSILVLANKKIGALIVIPGKESIAPYIIGGTDINALISEQLIIALFNKESPTHDGALIIENNIIKKFAVYLPLSKDLKQLKGFGTRHRAGLGISEKADALSIIVSEEKGKISFARNGNLQIINSKEELKNILNSFLSEISNIQNTNFIVKISKSIFNNFISGLVSLLLAIVLWLSFSYPNLGIIQKNFVVPIEFINVPNNFMVQNLKPMEVTVTLAGKNQDFKLLDSNAIKVSIDLKNISKKDKYTIVLSPSNIKYPSVLEFVGFDPKKIQFTVTEKIPETSTSTTTTLKK